MERIIKGERCISKTGKHYYNYYQKIERDLKGRATISKSGKHYRIYYQRKYPNGRELAPYSSISKKRCLERDNYTCQLCSSTENLDVHHRDNKGAHLTKQPNQSQDNLQTLCHSCHLKLHYGVLGRDNDIMAHRKNGKTLQQIANRHGVSRQRIHQLIKNMSLKKAIFDTV